MEQNLVIQPNITDLLRELSQLSSRIHNLEIFVLDVKAEISQLTDRETEVTAQLKELTA